MLRVYIRTILHEGLGALLWLMSLCCYLKRKKFRAGIQSNLFLILFFFSSVWVDKDKEYVLM